MSVSVAAEVPTDLAHDIASVVRGFSIEATRPTASDVETMAQAVPAGTAIYLSAIPTKPHRDLIDAATRVRAAGLEPVPHLVARNFVGVNELDDVLSELVSKAQIRRVLMIAG